MRNARVSKPAGTWHNSFARDSLQSYAIHMLGASNCAVVVHRDDDDDDDDAICCTNMTPPHSREPNPSVCQGRSIVNVCNNSECTNQSPKPAAPSPNRIDMT